MNASAWGTLQRFLLLAAGVVLLNFLLPRALPGDPLSFSAGEGTDAALPLPAAERDRLRAYYHLDDPFPAQFAAYLHDLARGDLGHSIAQSAPVRDLILERLPWTLALLLVSLFISVAAGTAAGLVAGWMPRGGRDRFLVSAAGAMAAIPEFLVAIGLWSIFAAGLGWFPLFGGESPFTRYAGASGAARHALDVAWHLALPAVALVLTGTSAFLLIARDATAGIRHAPWLTVARAKGLRERDVAWNHALPNVALPLLTFFVLRLGGVLSGALVVERVFAVPGLGLLGFQAIRARDYPVLQALFLLSSLGILAANLTVEIVYYRFGAPRGGGHD